MKKKETKLNKLGFMALVGLLGLLGVFTENRAFLGFFGYLYYIRYFMVIPDELFQDNIKKAGCIGFFTGIAFSTLFIALCVIANSSALFQIAFIGGFVASMFGFSFALVYFECKEQKGIY